MIRLRTLLRALSLGAGLLPVPAQADTDYTDTWWSAGGGEPGWGITFTHQAHFIFGTFYVYGPDGKATWFSTQMTRDGIGDRFTGNLYRISGTFYGEPVWQGYQVTPAGSATFTATSAYAGSLVYNVDGATISKSIERLKLVELNLAGRYVGGVALERSGCAPSGKLSDPIVFDVLHSPTTGELRIDQLSVSTGHVVCRMEGIATQFGKLLLIANASYSCPTAGWDKPARVYNLRPTVTGFEAQWFSDGGGGCTENGELAGVRAR